MDPPATDLVVVVDNQTFTLQDDLDGSPMAAIVRWSMLRVTGESRRVRVTAADAAGRDAGIVASDLRFELLSDDLYHRMTRGVEVILHEYEVFDGPTERCRAAVARGLAAEVIGQAITWPITW